MTTLIVTLLLSLGVIESPASWYQMNTSEQSEALEIIIEDMDMN